MRRLAVFAVSTVALALAACSPNDPAAGGSSPSASTSATSSTSAGTSTSPALDCSPETMQTLDDGVLTIATDQPAYEPWMVNDDPTNKQGFESAVAYAVAGQLGYADDAVKWTRVPFNAAIQPGPKSFDFDINQFTITKKRKEAVDFSSPYYRVTQAVVATTSSPAANATSLADLKTLRIGAQISTTSLAYISSIIRPDNDPAIFNTNDDAKLALQNGQVDAIVVDLPTAFYITSAQLDNGVIVGQLQNPGGTVGDQFGLLLDKNSPLTACVSQAVDALAADGTLDSLEQQWLADVADAPVLS